MPQAPASKTGNTRKLELAFALVLFVIALGLLAWYYELLPFGGSVPSGPTAEEMKAYEQQQEQIKRDAEAGRIQQAGS